MHAKLEGIQMGAETCMIFHIAPDAGYPEVALKLVTSWKARGNAAQAVECRDREAACREFQVSPSLSTLLRFQNLPCVRTSHPGDPRRERFARSLRSFFHGHGTFFARSRKCSPRRSVQTRFET